MVKPSSASDRKIPAREVDIAAPAFVEEALGHVAVSDPATGLRYFRSFHAEILSGHTWFEMFRDALDAGTFVEGDVDLLIDVEPLPNDRELDRIARRIAHLIADRALEENPSKAAAIEDELADLRERQRRIRMSIERAYRVRLQVTASAKSPEDLRLFSAALVKRYAGKSIFLRPLDGLQLEGLKALVPTASFRLPDDHAMTLETSNIADFFPYGGGTLSHTTGVILGRDIYSGRPVWLDAWDRRLPNSHMMIIGRSGAGKSYTVMTLVHRSALLGIKHAIIDWKGEYEDFLTIIGMPFISLSETGEYRLNPYDVDITEDPSGARYVDLEEAVNFVQAIVFKMIRTYDEPSRPSLLTPEVKTFINHAIRDQYRELGITRDPNSLYERKSEPGRFSAELRRKPMPTLSGLYERMVRTDHPEIRAAASVLKLFTRYGDAPSYAIFDGQSTVEIGEAPIFAFAVNRLDKEIMRPIGLTVATRWVMERWAKKRPLEKKRIVVEEAQNLFNDPDVGSVWMESAYREARSTNTSVCSVTQGLEVFTRSQSGIAALKNSTIKLIGIQERVDIQSVADVLDLTEGESEFITRHAYKGNLLIRVDQEGAFLRVEASPYEHMMFTSDPNDPAYLERKMLVRQIRQQQREAVG
ncbi:MAG: hypothetical protein HSCHL_0979 [Hydrogenibacillus schlegelii]|uniref:TraG P-loop domain-containing protein n=1 Tax=Hydrogenibacillus schlegelii TaxID=1484 RepID=A0A2T5G6U2_HYDSH|nr:DUF87 domain-containing protein [Hydrogenibacillus schlegelii]PTQ51903.1 MAG: hypothetical protein HSCHL_0979 [Hydrogenibacillus schlegelii]